MSDTKNDRALRVGLVGARSIGLTHGRALAALAGQGFPVAVVAVSGGEPSAAEEMGWEKARRVSPEEILEDPSLDVVVLCSPTDLHGVQALRVATSGRHVVVEKPLALDPAEAYALVQAQARSQGTVAMISQRRYEFPYPQVKALLESGVLGVPRFFAAHVHWYRGEEYFAHSPWRSLHARGGGSLVNQGVHSVDLLQWLAGPVRSVTAQVGSQTGLADLDDTVAATLAFDSGALGVLTTSTATPPGFDATLTLHTTKGRAVLGQGELAAWEMDGVKEPLGEKGPGAGARNPLDIGIRGHEAAWRDILTAIRGNTRPLVDAREGYKVTALIDAIYRAAQTGRAVRLP